MIKYVHNQYSKKKSTLALEMPLSEELIKCSQYFVEFGYTYISLNYGITIVHPKDQFNKRIGREQAKLKMKTKPVEIISVYSHNKDLNIRLKISKDLEITLKMYYDSKKIRIIRY